MSSVTPLGDAGMTIRGVAEAFIKLKAAAEARDDDTAQDLLEAIKTKLIVFPTFMNPTAASPTRPQEVLLAREVLEHGVLLSARKKDVQELERYYHMLKPYYTDVGESVVPESSVMHLIMGLNLIRLLVCHRVAEFHSELETIPASHHRNLYIRFAIQMERYLMEGSYNKLLHARSQAPSKEYVPVVELLEGTVRQEVARCLPAAYARIGVGDAGTMMMLKSTDEVLAVGSRQGWTISDDKSTVIFQKDVDAGKRELPCLQILEQNINFAAELQRVV